MLFRFLLLLFLFLSFPSCYLIKDIEEHIEKQEQSQKKQKELQEELKDFSRSLRTKVKMIKTHIQEMREEGKEVIMVRPNVDDAYREASKCISSFKPYLTPTSTRRNYDIRTYETSYKYANECLKKYEKKLEAIITYYVEGLLTNGLKEVLSKEQMARRIKEQEALRTHEDVVCYGIKVSRDALLKMVQENSFERDWRYREWTRKLCRFKRGIYGKGRSILEKCVNMEAINIKQCFENWVFKLKKHLEPQCFTNNDKIEYKYLLCLKKQEKHHNTNCSYPVKRNCLWEAWEKFAEKEGIRAKWGHGFLEKRKK